MFAELTLEEMFQKGICRDGIRRVKRAGFSRTDKVSLDDILEGGLPKDAVHFISWQENSPEKFRVLGEFIKACIEEELVDGSWSEYADGLVQGNAEYTEREFPDVSEQLKDWSRPMKAIQEIQNGRT